MKGPTLLAIARRSPRPQPFGIRACAYFLLLIASRDCKQHALLPRQESAVPTIEGTMKLSPRLTPPCPLRGFALDPSSRVVCACSRNQTRLRTRS